MGSWKSSSSKSLLDGMLDFEEQLDYEPDGIENEAENCEYSEPVRVPKPSSSKRHILSYGKDLERARSETPSCTASYRDKMNYNELHIDVEEGSCQSKFGRHLKNVNLKHVDSSSEEEDFHSALPKKGATRGKIYKSKGNLTDENRLNLSFSGPQQGNQSFENYYSSSESYEHMVSPRDILKESVQNGASTLAVDSDDDPTSFSRTIQNKTSISPRVSPSSMSTGGSSMILDNYIVLAPRKPATITSESRMDNSPKLEEATENNVYLPLRQQTVVANKNRQYISPNVTQNSVTDSLRGKKITIRNDNRREILSDSEKMTPNKTADLSRKKQLNIVTRNRTDSSSDLQYETQNNVADSLRGKQFKVGTDNRKAILSDSEKMTPNKTTDLSRKKQLNIVTRNRRDSSSGLQYETQNNVTDSLRGKQFTVGTDNRREMLSDSEKMTMNKSTDLPRKKQLNIVTRNRRDSSSNLEYETQDNVTDSLHGKQFTVGTDNRREMLSDSEKMTLNKSTDLSRKNQKNIVTRNRTDSSSDLQYETQNNVADSLRGKQITIRNDNKREVLADSEKMIPNKTTNLSRKKQLNVVSRNRTDSSSNLEYETQNNVTDSLRSKQLTVGTDNGREMLSDSEKMTMNKSTDLSRKKRLNIVTRNRTDSSSNLEYETQNNVTDSLRGKQVTVGTDNRRAILSDSEQMTPNKSADLSRKKQLNIVTRNKKDNSFDLEYETLNNVVDSLRGKQVTVETDNRREILSDSEHITPNKTPDLQRKKKSIIVTRNRRDSSSSLEYDTQNNATDSLRGKQITIRNDNRKEILSDSEHITPNKTADLPRKKKSIILTRNRRASSSNLEYETQNSVTDSLRSKQIRTDSTDNSSDMSSASEQDIQKDARKRKLAAIVTKKRQEIPHSLGCATRNIDTDLLRSKQITVRNENGKNVSLDLEPLVRNAAPDVPRREQTPPRCGDDDSDISPRHLSHHNVPVLPQQKRKSSNFKIQLDGNKRTVIQPIVNRRPKPWKSCVEDYIDDSDVVLLKTEDVVIEFLPESTQSTVRSRLSDYSENGSYSSESGSSFPVFKVPLKRPPTRQKSTGKNMSILFDLKSQQREINDVAPPPFVSQKDDIISIMAGSDVSLADDLEEPRDRMDDFSVKEEPVSLPESSQGTEQRKLERTAQWLHQDLEPRRQQQVPHIYRGLCYRYFLHNHCSDNQCKHSHLLISPLTHINQLPNLSVNLLLEAYKFAMENFFLYGKIYRHFANAFAIKDMKGELIKMIIVIFEETCYKIRPEEGLEVVLSALQKTNLTTFQDAVDYVLMQIGVSRYPTLENLLFDIVLNKPDVSELWPLIRKFIIVGQKMNLKQGTKFLVHLMKSPVNLEVCQEVYRQILSCKFVDLPKISRDIREQFLKTCIQENVRQTSKIEADVERILRKERFNYERTLQNKDPNPTPQLGFPPPLHSAGRHPLPTTLGYVSQPEFGGSSSNQPDFAALNQEASQFAPQAPINDLVFESASAIGSFTRRRSTEEERSQAIESFHDVDLRYPPPNIRKHGHNNNGSSDGDQSPQFSDSGSSADRSTGNNPNTRKRSAPGGMTYNREGLHYDPANDYINPHKKRIAEPISEFDRLKLSSVTFVRSNRYNVQGAHRQNSDREEAVNRPNPDDKEARPGFHRANHRARPMVLRRNFFGDGTTENHQPLRDHDEVSAHRPNHNYPGARLFEEPTRPASPNDDIPVLRPGFHRISAEVREGVEPFFYRPTRGVEDARTRRRPHQELGGLDEDLRCQRVREHGTTGVSSNRVELSVTNNEAAVSGGEVKLKNDKPPEHPQFGKIYFDPHYQFDISLHNLYLEAIDNVDIDEEDVHLLNDCVKKSDGNTFLKLIEKYKGPKTVQNFISMTLANLKGMNQLIARTYETLLHSIANENPNFYGNRCIRVILEVITMNLLFELINRNMVDEAYTFLNRFSDWDSLVTSRIFIFNTGISIIGRYIFIAKLLVQSKPELTYEILSCPTLHLLGKYENWPYKPSCPIPEIFTKDLDNRNMVITMFLKSGYLLNPVSVIQFYKAAFKKEIWRFDVKPYVNPMMMDLINKNHASLKLFINDLKEFHKHMTKDILRAFLICLCQQRVSNTELFMIYEKCVERNIYQRLIRGDNVEYTIEIKTNMHNCEIELIIKYYFQKLEEIRQVPRGSESLRFNIKLPGESLSYKSLPILNTNKSLDLINDVIKEKLEKHFSISSTCLLPGVVEVKKEELVNYLDRLWT